MLLNPATRRLKAASKAVAQSAAVFGKDVGHGLLVVGHNALATVGITTVALAALCLGDDSLRDNLEASAYEWLQDRSEVRGQANSDTLEVLAEPNAVERATAADINDLPRQQASLAQWISRRYRVAPEPVSALVREAWDTGQRMRLEPTLILAVMAIESRFNPFAQSPVGAQGLMQVLTRVHDDKYESFGGTYAAFDPLTNLRVGAQVLKESIARGGSVQEGLRHYVGAALLEHDGGYVSKIMSEQSHMRGVLEGRSVPLNAGNPATPTPRRLPLPALEAELPGTAQADPAPTPAPAPNRSLTALPAEPRSAPRAVAEQVALAR